MSNVALIYLGHYCSIKAQIFRKLLNFFRNFTRRINVEYIENDISGQIVFPQGKGNLLYCLI